MKQTPLKWIYNYSKKYLWAVILLGIISCAIALSFILLALISKSLLDIATGAKSGSIILQYSFLAGLVFLQGILNILRSNLKVHISSKIEMKIKESLFYALMKKQYLHITKIHSGEILNRFASDLKVVAAGVVSIIPQIISLGTKLFAGLFVLVKLTPGFALVIVTFGIVMYLFSKLYSSNFKHLHRECQKTDGKTHSFIQEYVENILIVKAFPSMEPVMKKLSEYQNMNYRAKMKQNAVSNAANTSAYIMLSSGYFLILAWGALQISSKTMTFGTLTAILQIIEQIKTPFRNMPSLNSQYYSMLSSAERLQELEDMEDELYFETPSENFDSLNVYKTLKSISFENVSFGYDNRKILNDISLNIYKNEFITITGASGTGKSTLFKLLLGLIKPDSGRIIINTTKGQLKIDPGTRGLFSYVPQTNMILSGTIRENISFFNPAAKEIQIIQALRTACIWDYIKKLPDGLDTVLGERGAGLSEGQIQRLAIARAILSCSPILLLDECTSALEEATEAEILNNIKSLTDKTVILISHKTAAINSCSKIIYVENRRVLEDVVNG
jgi:ATP-binding cassette, subfamily B, bacterial